MAYEDNWYFGVRLTGVRVSSSVPAMHKLTALLAALSPITSRFATLSSFCMGNPLPNHSDWYWKILIRASEALNGSMVLSLNHLTRASS